MAMSNLSETSSSEGGQFKPSYPSNYDRPIHKYKFGQKPLVTDIPLSAEPVCLKRTYFEPLSMHKQSPPITRAPLANQEADVTENLQEKL